MKAKPDLDPLVASLVRARKSQSITQATLAQAAGVSRRTLIMIEAGGDCTLSTLRRLYTVLGMDMVARPYTTPTLDDVIRENEALYFTSSPAAHLP
jgi:DNA-binding XRE family transcriptional regulator